MLLPWRRPSYIEASLAGRSQRPRCCRRQPWGGAASRAPSKWAAAAVGATGPSRRRCSAPLVRRCAAGGAEGRRGEHLPQRYAAYTNAFLGRVLWDICQKTRVGFTDCAPLSLHSRSSRHCLGRC